MSDEPEPKPDAIAEGAHARTQGRPKESCPHPANSPEQRAWLEGYDGIPADPSPDLPLAPGRR